MKKELITAGRVNDTYFKDVSLYNVDDVIADDCRYDNPSHI